MSVMTSAQAAKRALSIGLIAWFGVTILAVVFAFLVADIPGAWGAVVGSAISGLFLFVTAAVAIFTSKAKQNVLGAAIYLSWLIKIVVLMGALAWLRNQTFYDKPTLFLTLLVTTFGLLILEAKLITSAPVLYVVPDER